MDWKVFATTFGTIFIAELGDKTQFAAMAASAGTSSKMTVLVAVVSALALSGVIAVAAGGVLGEFLSPEVMKWVSGGLFIGVGIWTILS